MLEGEDREGCSCLNALLMSFLEASFKIFKVAFIFFILAAAFIFVNRGPHFSAVIVPGIPVCKSTATFHFPLKN